MLSGQALQFSELAVTSSGNYPGGEVAGAFNGDGLSGDLHNNLWQDGWMSNVGPAGEWIKVDLGGSYTLDSLEIWNGNQLGLASRGLQQADIFVAQSDPGNNIDNSGDAFDPTGWTSLLTDQQFSIAPGNGSGSIASTDTISLSGTAAFLAIRADSNYGHDRVAIGEIQILGTPTAAVSTSSLVVLDGTGSGVFEVGSVQTIEANPAPSSQFEFASWSGDVAGVTDVNAANTTFTMQSGDSVISANYNLISYELTVVGGEIIGTGNSSTQQMVPGARVDIIAPDFLDGAPFAAWVGASGTQLVQHGTGSFATFTMVDSDTTLTATYENVSTGSAVIPFGELTISASSTDTYAGSISKANQAFNGAGLVNGLHDGVFSNGWISDNGASFADGEWIKIDLGGSYDLDSLEIWNGNQTGVTRRGIKQGDIFVATSDPGNNLPRVSGDPLNPFVTAGWTELISDQQFAVSPGGSIASTDTISLIDSQGLHQGVSFLAIRVDSTYASDLNSVSIGEIQITGTPAAAVSTSSLVVLDGTGSGVFEVGSVQTIEANPAPSPQFEFASWSGDVAGVTDVNAANTTFTMQSGDSVISANYNLISYELTVVGGEIIGTGNSSTQQMVPGARVDIIAPDFLDGAPFAAWVGASGTQLVQHGTGSFATFTMVDSDTTLTATYENVSTGSALIPPSQLSAISSSQYGIADVEDAFDGTGLTGDLHSADYTDGWMSANTGAAGQWVIVDLGGTYTLDHLQAWNYNQAVWHERGIAQADIYYSTSGVGNNSHLSGAAFDTSGWQTLVEDQAFTRAAGEEAMESTDPNIALPNVTATHVAIVVDSNFGGNFVGFAEMQFYETTAAAATYNLSIFDGSIVGGSNSPYLPGAQIDITASEVGGFFNGSEIELELFERWIGSDASNFLDVNASSTTFTMPDQNTILSPFYVSAYELTVLGGTGSDLLKAGTGVEIVAPEFLDGIAFSGWTGADASQFLDVGAASTTFTMQSGDAVISANYNLISYELTVVGGQIVGGDSSTQMVPGARVDVVAPELVNGAAFVAWVGASGTQLVPHGSGSLATFTMLGSDTTITATYESTPLPAGTRGSQTVPNVILNDGIDSFVLEVDANGPVNDVTWNPSSSYLNLGPDLQVLRDDGLGSDRVAGDFIFTSEPITYNTNVPFPDNFRNDANSPEGLETDTIGTIWVEELNSSLTSLITPDIGFLRQDVPIVSTQTLSDTVVTSSHLVNIQSSERRVPKSLRGIGETNNGLHVSAQQVYDVLPDAFDFLTFLSTSQISSTGHDNTIGIHASLQVNYSGTGPSPNNHSSAWGSDGKLLGVSVLDTFERGLTGRVATHEILHQWGYHLDPSLGLGSSHPYSRTNVGSLLGGYEWIENADGTYTVDFSEGQLGATHISPLDAYLMGLTDGSDIGTLLATNTFKSHITQDDIVSTVTLADIQAIHGVRTPVPADSQRDFSIGFVVESNGRLLSPTEMTFYNILAEHYTSDVPSETPEYRVANNWPSIEPYFGNGTSWTSEIPTALASSSALAASSATGDEGGSLTGLNLESQQLSATDEALLLFEEPEEVEESSNSGLQSDPYTSSDLDNAFQQLGLLGQEENEEDEDFGALLVTSGLVG